MLSARRTKHLTLLYNEVPHAMRATLEPLFDGDGEVDYACPRCGATLCAGMREGELEGLALRCGCGAFSRVGPGHEEGAALLCA